MQLSHLHLAAPKARKNKESCSVRKCNLCNEKFLAVSRFERFCRSCKTTNEIYQFHETLPTLEENNLQFAV